MLLELYGDCRDEESTKWYFEEKNKLNKILIHEELYWKQRVKAFWLAEGYSKSKFFHAYASKRKKINFFLKLIDDDGVIVDNREGMSRIINEYFTRLFGSEVHTHEFNLEDGGSIISEE